MDKITELTTHEDHLNTALLAQAAQLADPECANIQIATTKYARQDLQDQVRNALGNRHFSKYSSAYFALSKFERTHGKDSTNHQLRQQYQSLKIAEDEAKALVMGPIESDLLFTGIPLKVAVHYARLANIVFPEGEIPQSK